MIVSPCKQCNERRIACHARCERYREWFVERQVLCDAEKQKSSYSLNTAGVASRHWKWVKEHK
nr:MAG TPA: hypothetical protein [Caudoviricetes sp.]